MGMMERENRRISSNFRTAFMADRRIIGIGKMIRQASVTMLRVPMVRSCT
jgi:hypothetical protein